MRLPHAWHGWFLALFLFCAAIVFSNVVHWVLFRLLHRQQVGGLGLGLGKYLGRPARAVFVITCVFAIEPFFPFSRDVHANVREVFAILMVLSLGGLAIGFVYVAQNLMLRRFDLNAADNVQARRVHTQFQVFRRMVIALLVVLTVAAALYTFHDDRLWRAGTGLLASAGLASLVLATAAKSTASNFLAGLQIALTQPIRIDDVVIVQGEWGRVEEITQSYVVVRIWDLRRLIVPLTYFIENSFQNWTRESSDLLGTAFLYLDYAVPVEPLREHLHKIVSESKQWDRKVCGLQVTDLKEHTMELRCLMSAANASDSFDLRCIVREEMMRFVRENYPTAFPQARIQGKALTTDAAGAA
jgi:small-conductance mechanosensitive channel